MPDPRYADSSSASPRRGAGTSFRASAGIASSDDDRLSLVTLSLQPAPGDDNATLEGERADRTTTMRRCGGECARLVAATVRDPRRAPRGPARRTRCGRLS